MENMPKQFDREYLDLRRTVKWKGESKCITLPKKFTDEVGIDVDDEIYFIVHAVSKKGKVINLYTLYDKKVH